MKYLGLSGLAGAACAIALTACGSHPTPADASDDFLLGTQDAATDGAVVADTVETDQANPTDAAMGSDAGAPDGDSATGTDAAPVDAPGSDAAADAALDAATPVGTDPCRAGAVVALATAGTRSGDTVTYAGSTAAVDDVGSVPAACVEGVTRELAMSYVVATRSHLRVSTANAGTGAMFDTVAWALDRCAFSGASLGCADDSTPGDHRSTFTTAGAFDAGTTVYLFVAGYTPMRPGYTTSGAFELTVTEVPEASTGGTCDPSGAGSVCMAGSSCIDDTPPAMCVVDGTMGGRCHAAPPGCDTGLGCNGDRLSTTTRCVPQVPRGAACDTTMQTNVCATGSSCIVLGGSPICA